MWTPLKIARLMGQRILEWSSCAFACKLPSDDETDAFHHSTNETSPTEFEQDDQTRISEIKPRKKPSKHKSNKHRSIPISLHIQDSEQPNNRSTRLHCQPFKEENLSSAAVAAQYTSSAHPTVVWPQSLEEIPWVFCGALQSNHLGKALDGPIHERIFLYEEDYILFCVKDDGTFEIVRDQKTESGIFEVVKDQKTESVEHVKNRTELSSTINREIVHGEDTDSKYGNEDVSNQHRNTDATNENGVDFDPTNEEFEQSIYFDSEAPQPGIREEAHLKKWNDEEELGIKSETNFSQSSTGSFTFPVLSCEWNGSPVKIPKAEAFHLRKHKPQHMGLQCCKF